MTLGQIIKTEGEFIEHFGTNYGDMRLSTFTNWCDKMGLSLSEQQCLEARIEHHGIMVQFDTHMDAMNKESK